MFRVGKDPSSLAKPKAMLDLVWCMFRNIMVSKVQHKHPVLYSCVSVLKNQNMLELKMHLEELQMENEYQLRLKDMNHNEKMKEISDKFSQQIESLKNAQQVCQAP